VSTVAFIQELKNGIDYDTHGSDQFVEE